MKSLFKKKKPALIGLDIGTRQVKAVLLTQTDTGIVLQGYACELINKLAFAEREVKDFEAVSLALKKVKASLKTRTKDCVIAVAGNAVISKTVYMAPDQNDYELETQIEIEADSLIPYPLEEVYLDFEELGPSKTHLGKVNVLLSAAHKETVDTRMLLAREIPFEPRIVDVEGYALGNSIKHFYPSSDNERICCVNVGASLLQICVVEKGEVLYSKEHSFGANNLVQDIAAIHMMEREQAEKDLINNALNDSWQQDTLPIFAANLQQQISRAVQMYVSTLHAERPTKILLSGGAAVSHLLVETLQQDMDIDIEVFNPFASMSISPQIDNALLEKIAPQLAIAAGLASRSFYPWHR